MAYHITFDPNPSAEDVQVLGDGIMANAKQQQGLDPLQFFAFFVRDDQNKIIGGCNGSTLHGGLYIDQLWVDESIRHQHYGTQLMQAAEQFGKEKGCTFATVNTMSWEAPEFYKKLGFEVEFVRHGFMYGATFYFLRKALDHRPQNSSQFINTAIISNASLQTDMVLNAIVKELQTIYHCHTIILYGSRARGDFKPTSDYDVAGITANGDKKWISRFDEKHQVFHDIFIFPEKELATPNETHLQMSDGIVIIDHNDIGQHLIETLKTIEKEPLSITVDEIQARKTWYQKMLARAEVGDLEGQYRHIWSIFTILEDYFAFKQLRYRGPKKAFQYLAKHDPDILNLFEHALSNTNDIKSLKQLIEKITENNK